MDRARRGEGWRVRARNSDSSPIWNSWIWGFWSQTCLCVRFGGSSSHVVPSTNLHEKDKRATQQRWSDAVAEISKLLSSDPTIPLKRGATLENKPTEAAACISTSWHLSLRAERKKNETSSTGGHPLFVFFRILKRLCCVLSSFSEFSTSITSITFCFICF